MVYVDGLRWSLRSRVQDLASTIAATKSLIEFRRESLKGQGKKIGDSDKGARDRDKSSQEGQAF